MRGSQPLPLTRYFGVVSASTLFVFGLALCAAPFAGAGENLGPLHSTDSAKSRLGESFGRAFGSVRQPGGSQRGVGGWSTEVLRQPARDRAEHRKPQPPLTSEEAFELVQSELREATGDRVFFAASSAELGARSKQALTKQAHYLVERPELIIVVEGHSDDAGSTEKAIELSAARANVVAAMLIEAGVARNRVSIRAAGNNERVAECATPACAAQNRRVVTRIVAVVAQDAPQALSKSSPPTPSSFGPRLGLGAGRELMQRDRCPSFGRAMTTILHRIDRFSGILYRG